MEGTGGELGVVTSEVFHVYADYLLCDHKALWP